MTATRAQVVAEARRWLGTPWVHQHRDCGAAVDCVGLVIGVARALGLVPPAFDFNGYSRRPDGTLLAVCDMHMQRIQRAQMQPGDVLVVAVERDPQHMGIVGDYAGGRLSLIHACGPRTGHGRVVEHRLVWTPRMQFRAAYALPGVG